VFLSHPAKALSVADPANLAEKAGYASLALALGVALVRAEWLYPLLLSVGLILVAVSSRPAKISLKSAKLRGTEVVIEVESPRPVQVIVRGPRGNVHTAEAGGEIRVPFDGFGDYVVEVGGSRWAFTIGRSQP